MGLAPTGQAVAFRQVHIVRFLYGKGIEHWVAPDDLDLARRLGGLPRPTSQPVFAMRWRSCCRTCTPSVPLEWPVVAAQVRAIRLRYDQVV
jgi:hypothetical protein